MEWHRRNEAVNGQYVEKNIAASELYDYQEDPEERKNVVGEEKYNLIMVKLKGMLKKSITKK
ncbi:MAG: DUF4976 domain-containing protein [Cytophagales bacterium]|nr:DUF4976 domain-containing protein [Cytophagales bacterium]